jgi:AraC-like DNA-binding protein
MDFVNTYRINHIKEQIAIPSVLHNYTIETVANNAGFSSRSAFYNAFKKNVGMSPVEYVRSLTKAMPC